MELWLLTIQDQHIWLKLVPDKKVLVKVVNPIMLLLLLDGVLELMKKVKANIGLLEIQEEKLLELLDIILHQEEIMIMVSKQIFWHSIQN